RHGRQRDRDHDHQRLLATTRRQPGADPVGVAAGVHGLLPDPDGAGFQGGKVTSLGVDAVGAGHAFDDSKKRYVPPWRNPWRRPYFLSTLTWLYILWTLVPVLIAVQFSFNDSRSRSSWAG